MNRNPVRWMTAAAVLLAAGLSACESESVFEGEPTVAPPVTTFDAAGTAERAIHGGILPISVVASDPYVGVDSVTIRYSGALQGAFTRRYAGTPAQVRIDTTLAVPFGTEGAVLFEAFGMNRYGSTATPGTATVTVVREDTVRPGVAIASTALPQRAELGDVVTIRVQAEDDAFGSGLARVGASIRVDGQLVSESVVVDGQASATRDIEIPVNRLASGAALLNVEFYAWAVDQAGNCAAVGAGGALGPCAIVGIAPTITGLAGVPESFQVTDTRSFGAVVSAGSIGDIAVDVQRSRVYYSNKANNSVQALSWQTAALNAVGAPVLVGAQPWGITLDRTGDTLIVANSGGHNISYVSLSNLTEATRYETPNAVLFQVTSDFELEHRDYSDRPQYIAQDSSGVVFYSTFPTPVAPSGSIRSIERSPQWPGREANMMLWSHIVDDNFWGPSSTPLPCYDAQNPMIAPCVIAFADSVKMYYESPMNRAQIRVFDHRPGFPADTFSFTGSFQFVDQQLKQRGSDVFMFQGEWSDGNLNYWLSGDTTLVVASGNRGWVGFAEADRNPGQLWLWGAIGPHPRLWERRISNFANVDDFVNNTSAPVTGLAMNHTGNLLVTRSRDAVHLVSNPLRLRGSYYGEEIVGGTGVGLHPLALYNTGDPNVNWAAVGGSGPEIILVDTHNFRLKGRIPLVEPVGGPIRVVARRTTDAGDILGHVFGVSQSGTVFWVPVRSSYFVN
jgi:hypothetical protein